ncbi:MAG TPA: TatD family hydrolase [Candidatus Polarisedimenticolaceae bacterium]|nr:TatD family hydrolase [Candidatus Polarisedimenticolaceae bacterium]
MPGRLSSLRLFDTHCHLTHPRLRGEVAEVCARAWEGGLVGCMTIGTGVADAREAREIARSDPERIRCAAGIDPFSAHQAGDRFQDELAGLRALLLEGGFAALGEIGLDYHHDVGPPPVQASRLHVQLELAADVGLPVVLHVREAHADLAGILREHPRCRGVVHSFTGTPAEAEAYLALGWHLAFNGILTYRREGPLAEAARLCPPDRLLVETDSPYLAPVPHRGRRCEPALVAHTLAHLAVLRGEEATALADVTTGNALTLFG